MIPIPQLLVGITAAFVGVIGWLCAGIKRVDFYAPFFDPSAWRADWAEYL